MVDKLTYEELEQRVKELDKVESEPRRKRKNPKNQKMNWK